MGCRNTMSGKIREIERVLNGQEPICTKSVAILVFLVQTGSFNEVAQVYLFFNV